MSEYSIFRNIYIHIFTVKAMVSHNASHKVEVNLQKCLGLGVFPLRVFAKYLKNGLTDLHLTLGLLRQLYRSSFTLKTWGWVIYCCHG